MLSLFAAILVGGCTKDNPKVEPEPIPTPSPDTTKPTVTLTASDVTETTFTFEIESSMPGTYGFFYAKDADKVDVPDMPTWFEYNTGAIEDKTTVTIEGLDDGWGYTLYLVVRATSNSMLSNVHKLQFKTIAIDNQIIVGDVGYDYFDFTVNVEGVYLMDVIEKAYLTSYNVNEENWLNSFGVLDSGPKNYEWYDGGSYDSGRREMSVRAGCEYVIMVAPCNSNKEITGEVYAKYFSTPAKAQSEEGIEVNTTDITSTSVKITATPSDNVSNYYIFVCNKATYENIVATNGVSTMISLVKSPNVGAWTMNSNNPLERVWEGLTPSTEYVVLALIIDNLGAEALFDFPFTTTAPTGAAPNLEVTLAPSSSKGHESMTLVIKSDNAATINYAFNTTADVDAIRADGYSDSHIAASYGSTAYLTAEQLAEAKTATGCVIELGDLWYDIEYTVLVSAKSNELIENLQVKTAYTEMLPDVQRVESELFETLLGKWAVTYSFIDFNLQNCTITDGVVNIVSGIDEYSSSLYREHNRLLITDWPFQYDYLDNPFYTPNPSDYTSFSPYWDQNPMLVYRDYGPKIFLEIAEGDVITIPTARNQYFYNEKPIGGYTMNFYGSDYSARSNAPVTFPVELSEDGNTITIKPYYDYDGKFLVPGATYYPALFRNNVDIWNIATTDIVLRRIEE